MRGIFAGKMKFLQKSLAFFMGTEYDYRDGQSASCILIRRKSERRPSDRMRYIGSELV